MSEAMHERDRVLAEVANAHAAAIADGLGVLERWARTGERFSANDVRAVLREVGVSAASMGALFNSAIKAGIIRSVGYEPSDALSTHHKPILRYIGTSVPLAGQREAITIPVVRNRAGRFSPPHEDTSPTLFDCAVA
jgi:hypothetical protein